MSKGTHSTNHLSYVFHVVHKKALKLFKWVKISNKNRLVLFKSRTCIFDNQKLTKNHFSIEFSVKRRLSSPHSPEKSDAAKCEHCGKSEPKTKLKKKPYCSTACSKAAKSVTNGPSSQSIAVNGDDKKMKPEPITVEPPASSPISSSTSTPTSSSGKRPNSHNGNGPEAKKAAVESNAEAEEQVSFLVKWTVDEVCDYIRNYSGYSDYAEDFMQHEIDGQALLLLNENHLVQTMNIKLGPALKIMSKIEAIKNSGGPMEQWLGIHLCLLLN